MARSPPAEAAPWSGWLGLGLRFAPRALLSFVALFSLAAQAAPTCDEWHAELQGVEGGITLRRAGTANWVPVGDHTQLCFDDTIRSDALGRALIVLPDDTKLRLDALTTMTLKEPSDRNGTLIDLVLGAIHVLSRDPRSLTIETPHVNAGLEGTEFDIRIAADKPQTEIAVLEGKVRVTNATGVVSVPSGNFAAAQAVGLPTITPTRAIDLMRWASYYPQLFAGSLPGPADEPTAAEAADAGFFARRAAARLRFGRIDNARSDLAQARRLAPRSSIASAVESVIALNFGDEPGALASAAEARDLDPTSAVPLLALSYAQQARGDLTAAEDSVAGALALDPTNALAWTRRAELALARGDAGLSLASAMRAVSLDAALADPHTVLGFAHSSRPDYPDAILSFERSIEIDPSAPLPHLGLGLALIASGARVQGRDQMEIAAALDPGDSLVRAYLSRAYDSEHRAKLTASQIELSKDFAPADPTPWLFEAVGTQSDNRPIDGLENLRAAASRNDDRAPFRSRLFLDDDLATRSTGSASSVYRKLGFEHLGLLDGMLAASADPTDYAAHRQLADLYSLVPRSEIARVSELQLATILEPATLVPLQPQLSQPSLFLANSLGPSDLATTELAPLLTENGLRLRGSAMTGANNTYGDDIALAGLHDRTSFSVGQYRWHTDGFRDNNDFDQRIANALLKYRASYDTSLVVELRSTETETGDLGLRFDQTYFSPWLRTYEAVDGLRLGLRHDMGSRDTLIVSLLGQQGESELTPAPGIVIAGDSRGRGADVQEIHRAKHWRLQSGVVSATRDDDALGDIADLEHAGAYTYAHIDLSLTIELTVGASADHVTVGAYEAHAVNRKFGLVWRPSGRVTLRTAAFETLEGSLTSSKQLPQPHLEPTQLAGFNQFVFGANGEASRVSGVGIDLEITPRSFAGVELARRSIIDRPVTDLDITVMPPQSRVLLTSGDETQDRAYIYWTPTRNLSLSAQYQYDRFTETERIFGFANMRARRLPLELRYFAANGWTAALRASIVHQEGEFAVMPSPMSPVMQFAPGEDSFSIVDLSVGYRLPKRRGVLSLNVDNLLDEDLRFQDIDAENPSFAPERMAYLRFTFSFD